MTRWLCLKAFVANVSKKCRLRGFLRGFFHSQPRFHVSEVSEVRVENVIKDIKINKFYQS